MSVEALMTQAVTLRTPSGETRDAIGGSTPTYTEEQTVMYLEPGHGAGTAFGVGREDMANRNTVIGDWFGVGRADVAWDAWQQVVYGSHVFDIVEATKPFTNPRTGQDSHVLVALQEVT